MVEAITEQKQTDNPMTKPTLDKVTVHISVGEGGQKLINAENIVKTLTGQATVRTSAKRTSKRVSSQLA